MYDVTMYCSLEQLRIHDQTIHKAIRRKKVKDVYYSRRNGKGAWRLYASSSVSIYSLHHTCVKESTMVAELVQQIITQKIIPAVKLHNIPNSLAMLLLLDLDVSKDTIYKAI